MNVFFDCEFTKFQGPFDTEPNELISIGCVTESGQKFYAENANLNIESCSEFVISTVIPLLEGGQYSMPYRMIAEQFRSFIESLDDGSGQPNVNLWTDAPSFDWPHIQHLFDCWGWPSNLVHKPMSLIFRNSIELARFENGVNEAFSSYKPALRHHHALDDAIANHEGYKNATDRSY